MIASALLNSEEPTSIERQLAQAAQDQQQHLQTLLNSSQALDYSKVFEDEMFHQGQQFQNQNPFENNNVAHLFMQQEHHQQGPMEPTPLGHQFQKNNSFLDGLAFLNQYNNANSGSPLNGYSSGSALNAAFQSNSVLNAALSGQCNAAFPQFTQDTAPAVFANNAALNNNPFANLMFIVDPTTQKYVCPKQVVVPDVTSMSKQPAFTGYAAYNNNNNTDHFKSTTHGAMEIQQLIQQGALAAAAAAAHITPAPSPPPELPPLRALSAYNFFFRDERDRILSGCPHDWSDDKQQALLQAHWGRDRTKKRRHRKTHGKIDFTTLSKLISQRWKELGDDNKEFYRQVASQDWERYQRELAEHKRLMPPAPVLSLPASQLLVVA
jgi:hypothetical protein